MPIHTTTRRIALLAAVGIAALMATPARADDCLLDRNNNGIADAATDNDNSADSGDADSALACGSFARALSVPLLAFTGRANAS